MVLHHPRNPTQKEIPIHNRNIHLITGRLQLLRARLLRLFGVFPNASAKFMQPSLKPSLVGPLPILREQSISAIYSAVNFALDKISCQKVIAIPLARKRQFTADKYKEKKTLIANFTVAFPIKSGCWLISSMKRRSCPSR
jgi:hypothetical protein